MTKEERDRAKIKWEASVAVGSKATEEKRDWLWNKYQKADIAYQLTRIADILQSNRNDIIGQKARQEQAGGSR